MERNELIEELARLDDPQRDQLLEAVKQHQRALAAQALDAIKAGDTEAFVRAVEAGADMCRGYGANNAVEAVEIAVCGHSQALLAAVLEATRNRFRRVYPTVLVIGVYTAVKQGQIDSFDTICRHIETHQAHAEWKIGTSPFHNTEYVYHVSLNGRVELAAENGHADMVSHLISKWPDFADYECPYRLLLAANKSGNPEVLKRVLAGGLRDRDEAYTGAAIDAIKRGMPEALELLIEAGLSLDAPSKVSDSILRPLNGGGALKSVRWVLEYEAAMAERNTGRIAEILR